MTLVDLSLIQEQSQDSLARRNAKKAVETLRKSVELSKEGVAFAAGAGDECESRRGAGRGVGGGGEREDGAGEGGDQFVPAFGYRQAKPCTVGSSSATAASGSMLGNQAVGTWGVYKGGSRGA